MRLVLIEWLDSFYESETGWRRLDSYKPEIAICRSVGWLVHDGPDVKIIVPHISDLSQQGYGEMTIPSKAVKSIRTLDERKPSKRGRSVQAVTK